MSWQRNALYTVFDSIERDLVNLMRRELSHLDTWLNESERERARDRLSRRGNDSEYNLEADYDLVWGLDLGDKIQILLRHSAHMQKHLADYLTALSLEFERMVPVRNATMHGRPLTVGAFAEGFQFGDDLSKRPDIWPELHKNYREHRSDPGHFTRMNVELEYDTSVADTLNNLPRPEYDDTGFLPRPKLQADLKSKILGRYPVLTVLGEGGNGKTALTLHTAYHLLDSRDHNFDAIIWVSAKSSVLNANEIKRIETAITDSLGLLGQVAREFGEENGDRLAVVYNLLSSFKVLLIIDNLETVLDATMRRLAEDVPGESKVVFTSRVPLGVDLVVRVPEFSEQEALSYARRLITAYGVDRLRKVGDKDLSKYVNRLSRKPLLIKWFVIGVLSGVSPDKIVSDPEVALKFCLENVIEQLDVNARNVALAFAALGGTCSAAVIQSVMGLDAYQVEAALATLLKFSLIEDSDKNKYENAFSMRPFTVAYMARVAHANKEQTTAYLEKYKSIEGAFQDERSRQRNNRYSLESYTVRSHAEAIIVKELRMCFREAQSGDPQKAAQKVSELVVASGSFFEVYRVGAHVALQGGDVHGAKEYYEKAIDIDDRQPQLHFWYGGYLMRYLQDFEGAAKHLGIAHKLDPSEFAIQRELARCQMFRGDWEDAERILFEATNQGQSERDIVVLADLKAQFLIRHAESLRYSGKISQASERVIALRKFVLSLAPSSIDMRMRDHIAKVRPTLSVLLQRADGEQKEALGEVLEWLAHVAPSSVLGSEDGRGTPTISEGSMRYGFLKHQGLQNSFGFITCERTKEEYFVHRNVMTSEVWGRLLSGSRVAFTLGPNAEGKPKVFSVEIVGD
jgi:LuxR family transcriptional regulator, glucitol operon activator